MNEKPRPCPWCAQRPEADNKQADKGRTWVRCSIQGCIAGLLGWISIERWNARVRADSGDGGTGLAEWLDMLVVALKASQKYDYNEWGQFIMGAESWADKLRHAPAPAEPTEPEASEFGDSFTAAVNAIKNISEDRRATAVEMLARYFDPTTGPAPSAGLDDEADGLHFAICEAVALMNQNKHHEAHDLLRQKLVDYADAKAKPVVSARTQLIREQQRSGGSEVTAVMVSPAAPSTGPDAEAQETWTDEFPTVEGAFYWVRHKLNHEDLDVASLLNGSLYFTYGGPSSKSRRRDYEYLRITPPSHFVGPREDAEKGNIK